MNNWLDAIESLDFKELPNGILRIIQEPEPGVTWKKSASYGYKEKINPLIWGVFLTDNGWQASYLPYHPKPNVYFVTGEFEVAEKIVLMMMEENYVPKEKEKE